jgi:hypothetical protein
MPEITIRFSELARQDPCPPNLFIMPSFARSVLEADGVHLTPFSGMEFVLHLFKASEEVIKTSSLPASDQVKLVTETSRMLQDRVSALEHDHRRVVERIEHQRALDAELDDFQENLRNEVFFMIRGLPRLPKMDSKEWQTRAKSDVAKVLSLLGFDSSILFIQNLTGKGKNPVTLYKVRVESSDVSRAIRDKFSSFFNGGRDSRPKELESISIRNCVTPGTLARIAILQLLGKRYVSSNQNSKFQVIGFEARPLLKLTPPQGTSGPRVLSFNFIEAVTKLPTSFTSSEVTELMKRISPRMYGSLKEVLIVVTDDMVQKGRGRGATSPERAEGKKPSKRGASPSGGPSAKK